MIDPQILRAQPDVVRASLAARRDDESLVDRALAADAARRDAIATFETLRAEQNAHGKLVAAAPKEEKAALVAAAQDLAERVKAADRAASEAGDEFTRVAGAIGNIIIDGVPAGGEEDFVTLREVGTIPTFDFEPRDHLELGEMLGAIDTARGVKVSGSRFYFLSGIGARLEIALMSLAL
ncbi:MAG: serine--tRNA ligase, partial [Actinomycetota bacterium]